MKKGLQRVQRRVVLRLDVWSEATCGGLRSGSHMWMRNLHRESADWCTETSNNPTVPPQDASLIFTSMHHVTIKHPICIPLIRTVVSGWHLHRSRCICFLTCVCIAAVPHPVGVGRCVELGQSILAIDSVCVLKINTFFIHPSPTHPLPDLFLFFHYIR